MNLIGGFEPDVSKDATTCIPAGVLTFVDSLDSHYHFMLVGSKPMGRIFQYLVEIDDVRRVAIDINRRLHTIDPHFGLIIDTIETEVH